ncbi:hypothetical protein WA158_001620 [Blastocystis sp. Blastoise]
MEGLAVVPGDLLGNDSDYASGNGTYVFNQCIFSSVIGHIHLVESSHPNEKPIINIELKKEINVVPDKGDIILGRVIALNPFVVYVDILCVNGKAVLTPFKGTLKKEDVREFEVDKVDLYDFFHLGDIIKAEILSRGDKRSYYLSTAKNEYGVVLALSEVGAVMIPISWNQMQCPETKVIETRKVAKLLTNSEIQEFHKTINSSQ